MGLPGAIHGGALQLPADKERDTQAQSNVRAAQTYLMKLYYWYMEVTMNGHYPLSQQHTPGAYIGKNYPLPDSDP